MADHAHAAAHAGAHEEHHPGFSTYWKVALVLTIITVVEVAAYYIPALVASPIFVPALLAMSAVKFYIVVAYYMHLKYDHKLFRALFSGPLMVAALTLIGLLFLFSKLVLRLGSIS
ncbi:MAG: cytochrome C oxidase subunit IV family protein [Gemmatimonadetes bacterium]|nr:cytochrome C oxidase subunit IV family protein [Gemmatimonadota bacterium]